jgi:F-type H+-transporting ATPase subunit epsilon
VLHARLHAAGAAVSTFTLHLRDASQYERIDHVESFVGRDESGSFGILAGHARMMTALTFGLARYRPAGGDWQYVALPGGLLYFVDNELTVSARRYLRGAEIERMADALERQLLVEEEGLQTLKESLRRIEEALFRHLLRMKRVAAP